ncbi:hypothetical protein KQI82_14200 [Oscillibacter sp. MSJ-2]|uniref:HAD family hydrolase n=1 Tax=Dysosmobacter acutus TaxID=2841504 RepID=A0ABS6FEK6_9FIRM|nr:hypothetical protein [Dysosmobacter acutus]MBU5628061.1 hypothetical protein [Dysosmobacter acutus]
MRMQGAIFDWNSTFLDDGGAVRPSVREFLTLMKLEDVWMYLITDQRLETVRRLDELDLSDYFRGIVAGDEAEGDSGELCWKAARRMKLPKSMLAVFSGDPEVLRSAKAAKFRTVGILGRAAEEEVRSAADEVMEDFSSMVRR